MMWMSRELLVIATSGIGAMFSLFGAAVGWGTFYPESGIVLSVALTVLMMGFFAVFGAVMTLGMMGIGAMLYESLSGVSAR